MRVFKATWFARFAGKEGITDKELLEAVKQLEAGQAEANLGGKVYKVRLARPGEGKSGGYRVIVLFKSGERTFFIYGFAKSGRSDIDEKEKRDFKKLAKHYFNLTDEIIARSVKMGLLAEILGECHGK